MPNIRTVTDVTTELVGSDAIPAWRVRAADADGRAHEHIFPHITLAWRAAEYGIDPTDAALLLDVVLHEPFLPDLDNPIVAAADPAARAGMTVPSPLSRGSIRKGDPIPVTLHNAVTITDARTAHLMRIDAVKDAIRIDPPAGKPNPLATIHSTPVDRALVAELTIRVDETRRRIQGERIPSTPQPPPAPVDETATRRALEIKEATRA